MDFSRETLYMVVTDRFAREGSALSLPAPRRNARAWRRRCGGSLRGLTERLDYIKALGMSSVWITPIVENCDFLNREGRFQWGGYHGYWARSFDRLDPILGDLEDLKRLLDKARQLKLKIYLDVVVNHTNPVDCLENGALYREGLLLGAYDRDPDQLFHHYGYLNPHQPYDPFQWEYHNVHGLADLNQRNPIVDEYLKTAFKQWMSYGFDGIRLDTASHVDPTWLAGFAHELRKVNPEAFFFGEWWDGGAHNAASLDFESISSMHLTDFGLARHLNDALLGGGFTALTDYLKLDHNFVDPFQVVTFLDSHDKPRFLSRASCAGYSSQQARTRLEAGIALLMVLRGIPCIYYGTEQYSHQDSRARGKARGDDPYNREPMPSFDLDTPLCQLISTLARLRREHPSFGRLPTRVLQAEAEVFEIQRGDLHLRVDLREQPQFSDGGSLHCRGRHFRLSEIGACSSLAQPLIQASSTDSDTRLQEPQSRSSCG